MKYCFCLILDVIKVDPMQAQKEQIINRTARKSPDLLKASAALNMDMVSLVATVSIPAFQNFERRRRDVTCEGDSCGENCHFLFFSQKHASFLFK